MSRTAPAAAYPPTASAPPSDREGAALRAQLGDALPFLAQDRFNALLNGVELGGLARGGLAAALRGGG
eukprot:CAMPEP_0118883556 /NCGR_PEP_ID=MMETSP1163-20130328/22605_1 /TAXON_ID=124430 /ORGANISM="Phaeomonas parva, Strain CCMP2877" /LENGTH=67 /DNA_ID=CAMNT_0006821007 /DNA_START=216 /DNA_END=416 /DNA_ORIENTATION=-